MKHRTVYSVHAAVCVPMRQADGTLKEQWMGQTHGEFATLEEARAYVREHLKSGYWFITEERVVAENMPKKARMPGVFN